MKIILVLFLSICSLNVIAQQNNTPQNVTPSEEQTISATDVDNPQYYLKVINKKLHPRIVYVDGQKVGVVKGSSEKIFLLSTKYYKLVELKEKAITLAPKSEQHIIQKRPNDGDVVEIVNPSK